MHPVAEEWAEKAARLEMDFDLPRKRAEFEALARMAVLRLAVLRESLSEVHAALLEAESGRPQRLEVMV